MTIQNESLKIFQHLQYYLNKSSSQIKADIQLDIIRQKFVKLYNQYLLNVFLANEQNIRDILISDNLIGRVINMLNTLICLISKYKMQKMIKEIEDLIDCAVYLQGKLEYKKSLMLICCGQHLVVNQNYGQCKICNQLVYFEIEDDQQNIIKSKNTTYAVMKHFDTCYKNIFKCQQDFENEREITNQIIQYKQRDRKDICTIEDIRHYLKQIPELNVSKYNKFDSYLMSKINNDAVFSLNNQEYNFIKEVYLLVVTIFYKQNVKCNNMPNCPFLIKKIINMLYDGLNDTRKQQCNKLIFVQKEHTVLKNTKKWQDISKLIDWSQLREKFAQVLEESNLLENEKDKKIAQSN